MNALNDRISHRQLTFLVAGSIIARGIFTIPRDSSMEAGPGAWLVVLINGSFALAVIVFVASVATMFSRQEMDLHEFSERTLSKWPGKLLGALVFSSFLIHMVYSVRMYAEVMSTFILFNTPLEVIIAALLIAAAYGAVQRMEVIARAAETVLPIMFVVFVVMTLLTLRNADLDNLRPAFHIEGSLVEALRVNASTWFGMQTLLVIVPFLRSSQTPIRSALRGGAWVLGIYLIVTVTTVGVLGVERTRELVWPSITTLRATSTAGSVFERPDLVAIVIWTSVATVDTMIHLAAAGITGARTLGLSVQKRWAVISAVVIAVTILSIKLFPDRVSLFHTIIDSWWLGVVLVIGVPFILFVTAKLRRHHHSGR